MNLENTTDIHWLDYLHNIRSPDVQNRHGVGSFRITSCYLWQWAGPWWTALAMAILYEKNEGKHRWTMGFLNRITHGIGVENPMGFDGETQWKPYILWGKPWGNP